MKRTVIAYTSIMIILLLSACSRINQRSRDHYQESRNIRHGIVPVPGNVAKKLDPASIERGKVLYQQHCMGCHGVSGDEKGVNLKKLAHEVRDFKFFMSISQWQGDMPGWKEPISAKEREDLASYIMSLRNK